MGLLDHKAGVRRNVVGGNSAFTSFDRFAAASRGVARRLTEFSPSVPSVSPETSSSLAGAGIDHGHRKHNHPSVVLFRTIGAIRASLSAFGSSDRGGRRRDTPGFTRPRAKDAREARAGSADAGSIRAQHAPSDRVGRRASADSSRRHERTQRHRSGGSSNACRNAHARARERRLHPWFARRIARP